MIKLQNQPGMTVSQVLAAHARARMAAARAYDAALHDASPAAVAHGPPGFIASWSQKARVIGWPKAARQAADGRGGPVG